jgi:AcrR family transcriptional regulator
MSTTQPVTHKGRATRDRILDTATTLIFEHGVAGTKLDDVRAVAKVSKGQLYHYFADKDDLIHAVIDRTIQQVLDAQPGLAKLSTWTAISNWLDGLVQLQVQRHAVGGCPIGSLEGKIRRNADPTRLATATLAAIQGGLVLTQTRRDPQQLRIALDAAQAYLRSFATERPRPTGGIRGTRRQ